jgi:hypothetical protein
MRAADGHACQRALLEVSSFEDASNCQLPCCHSLSVWRYTGERPDLNLRKVFKLTNATFAIKFKHFTKWRNMVVERRKAQGAAQQAAQMSAEAVALQASVSGQAGASGSSGSRRRA